MVKMNVKFETPEQLVEFSRMCQKVEADTLIEDTVHKLIIDGKSVMGMMTVTLNQRLIFVVDGSDEKKRYFLHLKNIVRKIWYRSRIWVNNCIYRYLWYRSQGEKNRMKTAGAGWIRLIRAGEKGNRCKSCTNSSL